MDPIRNFEHQHFAHCETGIMSTLLKYKGLELSEPMIFGLAGAICFAYLPFLKMGNMPLVSYRMFPGHIVKNIPRRLGIEYFRKTYKNQDQAMAEEPVAVPAASTLPITLVEAKQIHLLAAARASRDFGQKLQHVPDASRHSGSPLGEVRVCRQEVAVLLHRGTASRGVDGDHPQVVIQRYDSRADIVQYVLVLLH